MCSINSNYIKINKNIKINMNINKNNNNNNNKLTNVILHKVQQHETNKICCKKK